MSGYNCFLAGLLTGMLVVMASHRMPSIMVKCWESRPR